jgi:hypothetical protein
MVLTLNPASRLTFKKLTPSGVPGLSGSTGGVGGKACDHSGRASESTPSTDRTRADRLSDFRISRLDENKS